ncbi:NAD(P)/FAD-dependent oxidoreductase [Urechidicola vernalis]|uniref:FAD-dependent oxidoreductase n=1 Tax=Urechidicola vernalis TaxID=3075600 RepID=A0ABU2Y542_9FLAO|nr:FAD-dependent oxidoreductase [Urechidicola sp. P050]MDT0553280.1 FAD-dependent oxidoreductase [Urechidicola sp. P050]
MKEVDYIIVGLGLAGLSFARQLEKNNKSFVVYENNSQNSSKVAGGMYNPVILKRFTPVWEGHDQIEKALPFYQELEQNFNTVYDHKISLHRLFTSIEEQNNWFAKCDHPVLSKYLEPKVINETYNGISSPYGYGEVIGAGRIDAKQLLLDYKHFLQSNGKLKEESFDYNNIELNVNFVVYKGIKAKTVVFSEGYGIRLNPYFKDLPLNEVKGELITINSSELNIDFILKSGVFIMPLGNDLYKVGATFNWDDKTNLPTEEGKTELIEKLSKIIGVPFEVVDHVAGIRPTVKDRRPLVGVHPEHKELAVLNGLGTRGVMIAPTVSEELYNYLENGEPLREEINITRFKN